MIRFRLRGRGAAQVRNVGVSHLLDGADWTEIRTHLRQRVAMRAPGRPLTHRSPGEDRSVFIARGMDYAESRPYQPGDDMRSMHWQLLARTGKPHVKLYHEEQAGAWHGLIDLRGPMLFGTRVRTKAQQAARVALLAAGLQALASPQTVMVCTLWRVDGLHGRNFGRGPSAVRRLAAWLMAELLPGPVGASGRHGHVEEHDHGADFVTWSRLLLEKPPVSARLTLVSDWSWAHGQTDAALWKLAAFAEVQALRIRDPAEIELPARSGAWFEDMSDGAFGWVSLSASVRQGYAAAAAEMAASRARALRGIGISLGDVLTTDGAPDLLKAMRSGRSVPT